MNCLDSKLPMTLYMYLDSALRLFGLLAVTAFATPLVIVLY